MQNVRFLFLLLGLCWFSGQGAFLYAQDNEEENGREEDTDTNEDEGVYEEDWSKYMPELYSKGDKTFTIALGVMFPALFINNNHEKIDSNFKPPVGGSLGPLAYTYFLTSHFFVGGEVAFYFSYTLGKNIVYFIPIGARAGWQFVIRRFEIPLSITIGIIPERYLNHSYLGMFLKGEVSVYFRFNPDWSFGLNTSWNWYPQWPKENGRRVPEKDMFANMIGLTISARYHF